MKRLNVVQCFVWMACSTVCLAQTTSNKTTAPSDAQKSFNVLKTFAGTWQASISTPDQPQTSLEEGNGAKTEVTIRVTSRGNAVVHEVHDPHVPDDPAKYDHPVTMLYLDGDHLMLTHYCDSGNRPRMAARTSADGKTVEFDFVDVVGPVQYGHMHHAVFTAIDANHHTEDWTWMYPGEKAVRFHFDLRREPGTAAIGAPHR